MKRYLLLSAAALAILSTLAFGQGRGQIDPDRTGGTAAQPEPIDPNRPGAAADAVEMRSRSWDGGMDDPGDIERIRQMEEAQRSRELRGRMEEAERQRRREETERKTPGR